MISLDTPCPCHSGKNYGKCCHDYHLEISFPPSALLLIRSRYAAYALNLCDYIITTTHPQNPSFQLPLEEWKRNITLFCTESKFPGLDILDATETPSQATITFRAYLIQNQRSTSFCEKSSFLKVNGKWLYVGGEIFA